VVLKVLLAIDTAVIVVALLGTAELARGFIQKKKKTLLGGVGSRSGTEAWPKCDAMGRWRE